MKQIFAPWRLEYILGEREEGCIFCKKPAQKGQERENLILDSSEKSFVIMNRYPYNPGHVMVVPRRHVAHAPAQWPGLIGPSLERFAGKLGRQAVRRIVRLGPARQSPYAQDKGQNDKGKDAPPDGHTGFRAGHG